MSILSPPELRPESAPSANQLVVQIADLVEKNPTFWAPGKVEVEVWMVIRDTAYRMDLSNTARMLTSPSYEEANVPITDNVSTGLSLGGETRHYPDKYIWPGSILEFV